MQQQSNESFAPVPDPAYISQVPDHAMQRPHPGLLFEGYMYRLDQQLPLPSQQDMDKAVERARERFGHLLKS
jgi:hypothetical protein